MTEPRELLRQAVQDRIDAQPVDDRIEVNLYDQPPASGALAVPALVIRADNPWFERNDQLPFSHRGERYAVVAVVQAAGDAIDALRRLVRLADPHQDAWRWTETGGPVETAEEGGIKYLAATVRLTHSSRED